MFATDDRMNFDISPSPQSIGLKNTVTTPTPGFVYPFIARQKAYLAAGMGTIEGLPDESKLLIIGIGLYLTYALMRGRMGR